VRTDVVDFSGALCSSFRVAESHGVYTADRIEMRRSVDAKELKRLVDADRPKWAKVRWINISALQRTTISYGDLE
jgi:hypothetical protein